MHAADAPAMPPAQRPPTHGWREVRWNRWCWLWSAVPSGLLGLLAAVEQDINDTSELTWAVLGLRLAIAAVLGAVPGLLVYASPYFEYHTSAGLIEARSRWGRKHTYPRPGYELLEFSAVHGEIHEVGTGGRRHKLWISGKQARREDWRQFVECIHPDAGPPVAVRSSAVRSASE
ncbi:hypothetical protein GCM10027447_13900 [Glycomyces halotolerans]